MVICKEDGGDRFQGRKSAFACSSSSIPQNLMKMKSYFLVLNLAMVSCVSNDDPVFEPSNRQVTEGRCIGGLALPHDHYEFDGMEAHPVSLELQKAGIRCWEGDHQGRLTELYCLEPDLLKVRAAIVDLPAELRELVIFLEP